MKLLLLTLFFMCFIYGRCDELKVEFTLVNSDTTCFGLDSVGVLGSVEECANKGCETERTVMVWDTTESACWLGNACGSDPIIQEGFNIYQVNCREKVSIDTTIIFQNEGEDPIFKMFWLLDAWVEDLDMDSYCEVVDYVNSYWNQLSLSVDYSVEFTSCNVKGDIHNAEISAVAEYTNLNGPALTCDEWRAVFEDGEDGVNFPEFVLAIDTEDIISDMDLSYGGETCTKEDLSSASSSIQSFLLNF